MLDWLACFSFNWFQRDLCLQLNIPCRRNSANTLSVEFAAKSFFPISPKIKKTDLQRRMYFGDPRRRGLSSVRFDGADIESNAVKQTLTETKRLDTRPKYPKRCKEKYQKNLSRLSFKPDLANCGRLTKIDSTHWRLQRFSTTRNVFLWSIGRAMHLGWTWAFKKRGLGNLIPKLGSMCMSWSRPNRAKNSRLFCVIKLRSPMEVVFCLLVNSSIFLVPKPWNTLCFDSVSLSLRNRF